MRLEDKIIITCATVSWNTKKYSATASIYNSVFDLVGYGMQKHYIFLYSTRDCVITYYIVSIWHLTHKAVTMTNMYELHHVDYPT